ncbi:hypothetical protein ANCCAN_13786 [Ancylostoma caninum]|uniref:Uncharacterized protein n=1 Tax=Ancylostoma caninum TaxID=29170 RepID=A0A368GB83_ANCCA|nr:hypothetical protein ANCCAN_13786 [Ancylostoma caninum]
MAGESLKKKFGDFLVEQVFGKAVKYIVPEQRAARENEDAVRDEAKILAKGSIHGVTEVEAEDGTWIMYSKTSSGDGDVKNDGNEEADERSTEEATIQCEDERSYYRFLKLIPGKVPH